MKRNLNAFAVFLALENLAEIQDIFEIPDHSLMDGIVICNLPAIVNAVVISFDQRLEQLADPQGLIDGLKESEDVAWG